MTLCNKKQNIKKNIYIRFVKNSPLNFKLELDFTKSFHKLFRTAININETSPVVEGIDINRILLVFQIFERRV